MYHRETRAVRVLVAFADICCRSNHQPRFGRFAVSHTQRGGVAQGYLSISQSQIRRAIYVPCGDCFYVDYSTLLVLALR